MSKICLGIIENVLTENISSIKTNLNNMAIKNDIGLSFNIDYYEPLLCKFDNSKNIVFNILDSRFSENCELLLLPDDCIFNGRKPKISFFERMLKIQNIINIITKNKVHLFIGDSGNDYDEYKEVNISIDTFANYFSSNYNDDYHFIFDGLSYKS